MAELLIRDLTDDVVERLRRLAERHGRSLEQEVHEILRVAASRSPDADAPGLGTRIAARFAGLGLDTEFPEFRGQLARPAKFDPWD
jgi:antitoxin FitA